MAVFSPPPVNGLVDGQRTRAEQGLIGFQGSGLFNQAVIGWFYKPLTHSTNTTLINCPLQYTPQS